jgi:uncharacterized membrane protein YhaH (DUF805 family)
MRLLSFFLSFRGRIGPEAYVLGVVAVLAVNALLFVIGPGNLALIGGVLAVAVLIGQLAIMTKRLHDADRTGWWILLMIPVGFIALMIGMSVGMGQLGIDPAAIDQTDQKAMQDIAAKLVPAGQIALLVAQLGFMAALALLKPTPGPNRHGA